MTVTSIESATASGDASHAPAAFSASALRGLDGLKIVPWTSERDRTLGHDLRSAYVERFWINTLGPTTTWFLRHCATELDGKQQATVDVVELAHTLGIANLGAHSAMSRAMRRACRFKAARSVASGTLAVRMQLPNLVPRQVERLPERLQQHHKQYESACATVDALTRQRDRARRIASSLMECGDEPDEVEVQLWRLQFHPALASDAVRWAFTRPRGPASSLPPEAA